MGVSQTCGLKLSRLTGCTPSQTAVTSSSSDLYNHPPLSPLTLLFCIKGLWLTIIMFMRPIKADQGRCYEDARFQVTVSCKDVTVLDSNNLTMGWQVHLPSSPYEIQHHRMRFWGKVTTCTPSRCSIPNGSDLCHLHADLKEGFARQ